MERKLPTVGMGSVIVACIIVVLGTTMIPAFAAGTANPTAAERDGNGSATNCCCGAGEDNDVVDIDGDNNSIKIVIDGDSGTVEDVVADEGTDGGASGSESTAGSAGGASGSSGSGGSAESSSGGNAAGGGGGGAASVDVSVDDGDVTVNGRDVANEENDGMSNEEAKRTVARIVGDVGSTTVNTEDITRIVNENDINGGSISGINASKLAAAINAAGKDNDNGGGTGTSAGGDNAGGNDNAETGDNSQTASDIDDSTVLMYLLDQDFIDQSELRAAIENNSIDNSTILANIVNGDQTINQNSRYVDNSVTIDNSTTVANYITNNIDNSETTINRTVLERTINNIIENSTVVTNSTVDNSSVGGTNNSNGNGNGGGTTTTGTTTTGTTTTGTTTTGTTTTGTTTTGTTTTGGGGNGVDLSVSKTANEAVLDTGGAANLTVDFTVSVSNNGDQTAQNVVISDPMPLLEDTNLDELDTTAILLISAESDSGTYDVGSGNFSVSSLAPGETASVELTTAVVSVGDSPVNNTAKLVSSTPNDDTPNNNVGKVNFETLLGVITEQLTDPVADALQPVLNALGIGDLGDFLQNQILAGNLGLNDLINTLDNDNPVDAVINLLEDLTGQQVSPSVQSAAMNNTATTATTQSAHGPLSAGGLAVGGVASIGLLGSVVLFRRNR